MLQKMGQCYPDNDGSAGEDGEGEDEAADAQQFHTHPLHFQLAEDDDDDAPASDSSAEQGGDGGAAGEEEEEEDEGEGEGEDEVDNDAAARHEGDETWQSHEQQTEEDTNPGSEASSVDSEDDRMPELWSSASSVDEEGPPQPAFPPGADAPPAAASLWAAPHTTRNQRARTQQQRAPRLQHPENRHAPVSNNQGAAAAAGARGNNADAAMASGSTKPASGSSMWRQLDRPRRRVLERGAVATAAAAAAPLPLAKAGHNDAGGGEEGNAGDSGEGDDLTPDEFGWPDALFVAPVDELLRCPICACVLRDAVQCGSQHCFCHPCLMRALAEKTACPLCRKALLPSQVEANRMVRAMVDRLVVRCAYARRGCAEEITIGGWEAPLSACVFQRTECPNSGCTAQVLLYQLQAHNEECPYVRIVCDDCGQDFAKAEREAHSCIAHLRSLVSTMQSKLSAQDSKMAQVQQVNAQLEQRVRELEEKVQTARSSARRMASIGAAAQPARLTTSCVERGNGEREEGSGGNGRRGGTREERARPLRCRGV